jgi:heme a synthase
VKRLVWLVNFSLALAFVVIALGAYTRLTDAGLGCPDWPGCYGKLIAPIHDHHVEELKNHFPEADIVPHKAWNEMVHRYVAGFLGLCVLAIFIATQILKTARVLGAVVLVLVTFQAALGMWTVTMNLLPIVVLAHLVGGFALFSLLALLRLQLSYLQEQELGLHRSTSEAALSSLLPFAYFALIILILQILLGGWTSTNYAAVVCYKLPFCEAGWTSKFSLGAAFTMPLGHDTYEFGVLSYESRMSIHVLHRIGAIITFITLAGFLLLVWSRANTIWIKKLIAIAGGLLVLQVTLGLINVLAHLPLANAVAHNVVAALLLITMITLVRSIYLRQSVKN